MISVVWVWDEWVWRRMFVWIGKAIGELDSVYNEVWKML